MPGLARSDDHAFVQVMQHINRAVGNGWFTTPFLLPVPVLLFATVSAGRGEDSGAVRLWVVAALVLYIAAFCVTGAGKVPLNDALDRVSLIAGNDRLASARAAFEGAWVKWNTVRAVLHTAAFGCVAWALSLHGS
jgi:uncharacterized membrane protein